MTFAYDALSRRTSLTLPNGTQTSYTYDVASQVQSILHKITATNTPINNADYLYNNVGNRTQLTDRRGVQAFGYDNLDRLTSASHPLLGTPQAFSYDAVGNRTTTGNVVNAGNQLTADATHLYQYDDNGNLTRKTLLATGNYTAYTYDAENRLIKVEEFAAGNPTPFATSTYRYDGLGRRIEKIGNGVTRRYVYDGEDILLEYDGSNVLQARYTHGPGIDEPIAVTKGSSTYFYHQDGLGSVTDLTDSAGATAKSYSYDAYGTIVEQTGSVDQPYTYTGREFDAESGLLYYRARYYDPRSGRFLHKDPIGHRGGLNLYGYTRNNPINYVDRFGLFRIPVDIDQSSLLIARIQALADQGGGKLTATELLDILNFPPDVNDRLNKARGAVDLVCPDPNSGKFTNTGQEISLDIPGTLTFFGVTLLPDVSGNVKISDNQFVLDNLQGVQGSAVFGLINSNISQVTVGIGFVDVN